MKIKRFTERKEDFRRAIERLNEAVAEKETALVRDGTIQRFEFTYEMAWKAMKLWLEGKDIDVRNAKDTLREALQQGLIEDGNGWTRLHENRNLTSHTYDEAIAKKIYAFIKTDALPLFDALMQRLDRA